MDEMEQLSAAGWGGILAFLGVCALFLCAFFVPLLGLLYLAYFVLTLPMRRNERVRLFLDILGLGLKEGSTPEHTIVEVASSRDRSLGVRFHLLAAYIEQGMRLDQALQRVPRLLPPQVIAMLAAGDKIGDVGKVLPACRLLVKDSTSQVRGALNYLILAAFAVTPVSILVPLMFQTKVLPSLRSVFQGFDEKSAMPPFSLVVMEKLTPFIFIQIAFFCLIWLSVLMYLGGPRLHRWADVIMPGAVDRLQWRLPWRRKRMQRDFSAMLAVLLDSGVPEAEAVRMAADCTANAVVRRRAEEVSARLRRGVGLSEAVQVLDGAGELRWRLGNALQRAGGFVRALTGWHESLDAKAFQQEQTAAQLGTTVLVLCNGMMIGCIAVAFFLVLIQLINIVALW